MKNPDSPSQGTPTDRRSAASRGGSKRRVVQSSGFVRFLMHPVGKVLMGLTLVALVAGAGAFIYFYSFYAKVIDKELSGVNTTTTSRIFAAPRAINVGDISSGSEIAESLRNAGYNENKKNTTGYYALKPDSIDIFPGAESYFDQEPAAIRFSRGKIDRIVSLRDNTERSIYELEPQLVTNLHDKNREKRRDVRYEDIPVILRNAILSAEDHRFFSHPGFDPISIARTAWVDLTKGQIKQGASTLTMQLSKNMFLSQQRTWRVKAAEVMITMQLEQKLSKEKIFELYCNKVDLGRRGSFEIRGFGEAAQAYFGKDIKSLTVPEAATLAAMLKSASTYNPARFNTKTRDRRNTVLKQMQEYGYIDDRTYAMAVESPLKLVNGPAESSDAPYFVDMVNDDLDKHFPNMDFQQQSARIYTTLDLDLQKFANEAVSIGMKEVDTTARKQPRFKKAPFVEPQCALIALDPHTGEIKALVGGRNYGVSQLNHVTATRPTGSIFKPFVYATALNTAVTPGVPAILTPSSIVVDEPTTFKFDEQEYTPHNFEKEYLGPMTYRYALAHSINVAAIKIAELVGYDKVVDLAHRSGISEDVKATPAMAIGAYDAMPIEMAGAYTVFANGGVHVQPTFLSLVKEPGGKVMLDQKPQKKAVLDPRVNSVLVDMLQEVMRSGTAAGVHGRGFNAIAAGKTGTSHDGWFAGFTSDLLCIVWVGFDDYRELNIEGAHSALPVWTEFMKRAVTLKQYSNARPFETPDGVVTITIDPASGQKATPSCPKKEDQVFVAGSEPVGYCPLHGGKGAATTVSGWDTTSSGEPAGTAQTYVPGLPTRRSTSKTDTAPVRRNPAPTPAPPAPKNPTPTQEPKKKGLVDHIKDIFH